MKFNPTTWEEWKANPLTAVFLTFLKDQQLKLADQWMTGQELSAAHQAKALLMGELASLEWSDYARFYEIEAPE
jgi:hypothetical protein